MKKPQVLILVFILLVAAFFRFYQLNKVPPSPSLDEVSIGWNAYSILKTGRDEYGNKLPILLRAYDDWRPALYVYLVIPFVKLFGLSALAVRLPSVLLSLMTVLVTYFLVKELFKKEILALVASFLLTISPWHVYLSRLGHEVNAGLAFSVFAIFSFLKFIKTKKSFWIFSSAAFFSLSFYTYQSLKVFSPLLIVSLGLIFRRQLWRAKKQVILAFLLSLFLLWPILKASLMPEALIRFQATSVFRQAVGQNPGKLVFQSYFSHFKAKWLFFNSGAEDHKVSGLGLFYLWEWPLLIFGFYQLIKSKLSRQIKLFFCVWFLISPLAASFTTGAPHAMRTFSILPLPQVLIALGLVAFWKKVRIFFFILALISLAFLSQNYFIRFPFEQSDSFQYPLSQMVPWVLAGEGDYQKIIFTNKGQGYQSFMFFLFFSQYDPKIYLEQGGTFSGGYNETHQIGKYEFRPINWQKEKFIPGTLWLGNIDEFPERVEIIKRFNLLNNQPAMAAVENLNETN